MRTPSRLLGVAGCAARNSRRCQQPLEVRRSPMLCPCMVVRCLSLRLAFVVCCRCTHIPSKHVRYSAAAARCNALCYIWSMIMASSLSASSPSLLLFSSRCVYVRCSLSVPSLASKPALHEAACRAWSDPRCGRTPPLARVRQPATAVEKRGVGYLPTRLLPGWSSFLDIRRGYSNVHRVVSDEPHVGLLPMRG